MISKKIFGKKFQNEILQEHLRQYEITIKMK